MLQNNSPVTGANVKAQIKSVDDKTIEIVLFDDGQHGDGVANDGTYSSIMVKLDNGDYSVEATAEINGQVQIAATGFAVASQESKVVKTTKSARK